MKRKIFSVLLALVLVCSFSLVMAVPVVASHTSCATVAFTEGESTMQGEDSSLDVEVTNSADSLGNIMKVKIDFSLTDFTVIDEGTLPGTWTLVDIVGGVVTCTDATGIAPGDSVIFVPTVTNPPTVGVATNPTVKTTDTGSQAELEATEATGWIGYIADVIGTAGNSITIEYLDAEPYSGLIVSVVGSAISVELADDGAVPTSIASEVVTAINGDAAALLLVNATLGGDDAVVLVMSTTALSGGSIAMVDRPCPVTGILEVTELLLDVTVTPTPATSAAPASYVISFPTIVDIAADTGWITITFPVEYDITGVAPLVDVSVKDDTVAYTPGVITVAGQVVTIPAGAVEIVAGSVVEVTIANDHVKNPPASGDYDIAVATSGLDTGTGEVTITPASFGVVAGTDDTVTAGTAFAVTVTALNAEVEAEIDIGYTGDHFIDFTSGGTGTIPAFELITFTAGEGTSSQYFVLTVATETPTITATEGTLAGTSEVITINPATFVQFTITGTLPTATAGVAFATPTNDITVTAQDADGNTVTDYLGTVSWTSTDESAVLPAAYTFIADDEGTHEFLGSLFTLKTVGEGTQTITVTDAAAGVSKESAAITVNPAAAASIVVEASPGVIEADGTDSSTITVTAKDDFGNVDTNYTGDKSITIASSLGAIVAANPSFTLGEATTTLTSDDKVGTATIRVTSDFDDAMTTVKLLADIAITGITVTVDKTSILNNGVDVRTITATYTDGTDIVTAAEGADYTVTFTTDVSDPDEVTLNPADGVVVPVAGVATVTLTTTTAEVSITVTADGTGAADGTSEAITVTAGTYPIGLVAGWNLISLPLIPTDSDIDAVLAGADVTVNKVAYYTGGPAGSWLSWFPPPTPGNLDTMNDGKGYWIDVSAAGDLTVAGVQLALPGQAPPTYDLVVGWNLIGVTAITGPVVDDYLGAVMDSVQAMYEYNAATGLYAAVLTTHTLTPGDGYWLAVNAAGKIYP